MPDTVQKDRILAVETVKGKDVLLIDSFRVHEALSELFTIEAELLFDHGEHGTKPEFINPKELLGTPVNISVQQADDNTVRYFHGIVTRFVQGVRTGHFTEYSVMLRPQQWLLTQRKQSRIFQQKNVKDILTKVFEGTEVDWKLQDTYEPRNYCVQYRESDFDFASRLMEEEGIFYFFVHENGKHKMVLADKMQATIETSPLEIPFVHDVGADEGHVNSILSWDVNYRLQTGKVTYWDHNFELCSKKLQASQETKYKAGNNTVLEAYDFPGGYARKYDGVDPGGGDRAADLNKIFDDNKHAVAVTMDAIDAGFAETMGSGTSAALSAGSRFKLANHPWADNAYVLTRVTHTVAQSPGYRSGQDSESPFTNEFYCIPYGNIPGTHDPAPAFRPPRVTPKPIVTGSQTAYVVGAPGEEIMTDKYGRVKVQFHWDREGKNDAGSSCWVRVGQLWAGKKWGTMFIPRIGTEVIVDFLDGDPDRPIITGCVYNPNNDVPYALPDNKTRSTIKTNSTPKSSGFNELRFEDKKGEEQIYIHAEHDYDDYVKNIRKESIQGERHLEVKKDQFEKIFKDKHLTILGDHNEDISGTMSQKVGMSAHEKVGMNYALDAGMAVHVKAGMTMVLEAGMQLTLKVGGNFIDINPAGVFIQGTMVMINSGGAAGAGAGCSPTKPKEPKSAESGTEVEKNKKPDPPPPPPSDSLKKMTKVSRAVQKRKPSGLGAAVKAAMEELKAKQDAEAQALVDEAANVASAVAKTVVAAGKELPFVD